MSCRIDLWLASPSAETLFRPDQLSLADVERWTAIRSARQRRDFKVSRALLAHVGAARPAIASLSHSNGYAALAVTDGSARSQPRLGVDLEFVRPRDFAALSRFAFHSDEQCSEARVFYTRWTLKEAAAKALDVPLLQLLRCPLDVALAPETQCFKRVLAPRAALVLSVVAVFSEGAPLPEIRIVTHEWPAATKNNWTLLA